MPSLSTRGTTMPSSPIRKLVPFADEAKEKGRHVYHLNIVPEPFYTNYNGFAMEAAVKIIPITSTINDDFQLPPIDTIRSKINDKTRAILICNPNNPTGYVYSREELDALREIVLEYNIFLLADEVYREFCYDGLDHTSVMHLQGIDDRAILLDSISKRYSACGARIGCVISKNHEITNTALKFGMARLCPPTLEQLGAEAGINTPEDYFQEVMDEYTERRNVMVEALNNMPGVIAPTPKGAFYLVSKLPVDNADVFAQWLLTDFHVDEETVMVAPANGFYSSPGLGLDEVRIAYVLNVADIKKAMHILDEGLRAYPGRIK